MILTAPEAERGVLSSILWDPTGDAIDKAMILSPEYFSVRTHGIIFSACQALYLEGYPVDTVTLNEKLRSMGKLDEIGGPYGFSEIMKYTATASNIEYYAKEVLNKSKLYKLAEVGAKIKSRTEICENVSELISEIESDVFNLQRDGSHENMVLTASSSLKIQIQKRLSGEKVHGLKSGIDSFDEYFGGFQKGQYYVIGGRPSSGKTAFCDQIVTNLVSREIPVLYIALESSTDRVYEKIAHKLAGLVYTQFLRNTMSKEDLARLTSSNAMLERSKLILMRPQDISANEIRSIIRRHKRTHEIELVVLDYLQKIFIPSRMEERRGIGEASKQIQQACVDTGVPSLIVVQLNRESDSFNRPSMNHIKESGQIEQDADNIILLFPDPDIDVKSFPKDEMLPVTMAIEKNKDGIKDWDCHLLFDRPKMKFAEKSKYYEP